MLLHGNYDTDTYLLFFQHLSALFRATKSHPVFGTDDKRAFINAIEHAMPFSTHLTCVRQIREKANGHLQDKLGYCLSDRLRVTWLWLWMTYLLQHP